MSIQEFEAAILNEKKKLDIAMVRCCKKIVSMILLKEQTSERNGISLKDAILPMHDDVK